MASARKDLDPSTTAVEQALSAVLNGDPGAAEQLFAGLTTSQAPSVIRVSHRTANRHRAYARAWLDHSLNPRDDAPV